MNGIIKTLLVLGSSFLLGSHCIAGNILDEVEHGYAVNQDVKIHYATMGKGPLLVMLHGYPDYWYTWRHQMEALSHQFQVVAVDLRGYNLSDKPKGVAQYSMPVLISDIAAVIHHFRQPKATVIGHDWGGAIAWQLAIWRPELVENLVVLSTPHPSGFIREMRNNAKQQKNSAYARKYQEEGAHRGLTPESLAGWVNDEAARPHYLEAFRRSDFEAMLNYYKASYPKPKPVPRNAGGDQSGRNPKNGSFGDRPPPKLAGPSFNKIQCSVLAMFGLQDKALLAAGFNDSWQWIKGDLTLVSIPGAGHFIQQDASEQVTRTLKNWLAVKRSGKVKKQSYLHPDSPPETEQFGQLFGTWDAAMEVRNPDGSWPEQSIRAEWRWYSILDGQALQDDWILLQPESGENSPLRQKVGTNIRTYDPKEKRWKVAWMDIRNRQLATFSAIQQNQSMVMTGKDTRGRLTRITFFDIGEQSFQWKKEWTSDEGNSWFEVARMHCLRK